MDFFNFDWFVRVFNEFKPERVYYRIQDISYGKENFAVSCVNSLDKNYPEYVEYSRIRIPQSNVKINTGKNPREPLRPPLKKPSPITKSLMAKLNL